MVEMWVKNIVMNGKLDVQTPVDLFSLYIGEFWQGYFDEVQFEPEIFPGLYLYKYASDTNADNRRRRASVALFTSGSINVTGIRSVEEGRELAELTERMVKEFQQYVTEKKIKEEVELEWGRGII